MDAVELEAHSRSRFKKASRSAHRVRKFVSGGLLVLGGVPLLAALVTYYVVASNSMVNDIVSVFTWMCLLLVAMAVRPTDGRLIRALCIIAAVGFGFMGLFSILAALANDCELCNDGGHTPFQLYWITAAVSELAASLAFASLLRRSSGSRWRVPARAAYNSMFVITRALMLCKASFGVLYTLLTVEEVEARSSSLDGPMVTLACAACIIGLAACANHANRGRATACLTRIGMHGEEGGAAAVSAMISGIGPDVALRTAKQAFRILPLDQLREADLEGTSLVSDGVAPLHERSRKAELGQCTAFMSHSWRDSASAKFEQLEQWAGQSGVGAPSIWLGMRMHMHMRARVGESNPQRPSTPTVCRPMHACSSCGVACASLCARR